MSLEDIARELGVDVSQVERAITREQALRHLALGHAVQLAHRTGGFDHHEPTKVVMYFAEKFESYLRGEDAGDKS